MEPVRSTSPWVAACAVAALVLLLLLGGMAMLRSSLLARIEATATPLSQRLDDLSAHLPPLDSRLSALESARPDMAALDATHQQLADAQAQLADAKTQLHALQIRVEALESKTSAPAPAATSAASVPTAPQVSAPSDSEALAMQQLRAILATLPTAPTPEDSPALQALNQRLGGLIRIHKSANIDPYAAVRTAADAASAQAAIRALNEAQRAPFAAWLTAHSAPAAGEK